MESKGEVYPSYRRVHLIHFIDGDGEPRSKELEVKDMKTSEMNMWILQHVIIVKIEADIIAVDKVGLEQRTISSVEDVVAEDNEIVQDECVHYDPSAGIRFLSFILVDEENPGAQFNTVLKSILKSITKNVVCDRKGSY